MIFGTSGLRGPDTALEAETSKYYQAAWVSFAKDPKNTLTSLTQTRILWSSLGSKGTLVLYYGLGMSLVGGGLNVILPFALR